MAALPFFVRPLPFTVTNQGNQLTANPVLNLADFHYAGATWKSSGASNLYFSGDLGAATAVDFAGMLSATPVAGTNFMFAMNSSAMNGIGTGAAYTSGTLPFISPALTTRTLYHSHLEIGTPQTYRHFDFYVSSHTGDFEAAFLVVGKKIAPTRYYDNDYERGFEDLSRFDLGRNGVPDIAYGSVLPSIKFQLAWLTEDEHENYIDPMLKACGTTEPLYLCFDPSATTSRQQRTYFGRVSASPRGQRRHFNTWVREFTFTSLV